MTQTVTAFAVLTVVLPTALPVVSKECHVHHSCNLVLPAGLVGTTLCHGNESVSRCCISGGCDEGTQVQLCDITRGVYKAQCVPCPEGYFQAHKQFTTDMYPCQKWKSCPYDRGWRIIKNGTRHQNRECVCDQSRGYYEESEVCFQTQCPAGEQVNMEGDCDPCPRYMYKSSAGFHGCLPVTHCEDYGWIEIARYNKTHDAVCQRPASREITTKAKVNQSTEATVFTVQPTGQVESRREGTRSAKFSLPLLIGIPVGGSILLLVLVLGTCFLLRGCREKDSYSDVESSESLSGKYTYKGKDKYITEPTEEHQNKINDKLDSISDVKGYHLAVKEVVNRQESCDSGYEAYTRADKAGQGDEKPKDTVRVEASSPDEYNFEVDDTESVYLDDTSQTESLSDLTGIQQELPADPRGKTLVIIKNLHTKEMIIGNNCHVNSSMYDSGCPRHGQTDIAGVHKQPTKPATTSDHAH